MLIVILIYVANSIVTGNVQNYAVRLNNTFGNNTKEGRLEIYYSGIWGTVCDDYFTNASAKVACNSLGFGYMGAVIDNRYVAGTDPIWLDDVNCTGSETGIEQCAHDAWGVNDCGHSDDVSISCDCSDNYFSGPTGQISSRNFPLAYSNNLDCFSYIAVLFWQKITITFLAFNTESTNDWVTVTCTSGNAFTSSHYSGSQIPPVLVISSCNQVNVYFHTDSSTVNTGFNLVYNITSDCADRYFNGSSGQISSPNYPMTYTNYLDCSSYITVPSGQTVIITFLSFNTEQGYDFVTITCASGNVFGASRYWGADFPAILAIPSCNLVNVYFHTDGFTTYRGFSLTYNITSDIVRGGITAKPSNAFPRSDSNDPVIFNCTTSSKYFPWWSINDQRSNNYTMTNSSCGLVTSAPYSWWFKTETLGPGSCNLIMTAPANYRSVLALSFVCRDATLASSRAILAPIDLELRSLKTVNYSTTAMDDIVIRDEELMIFCSVSFTDIQPSPSLIYTYFLYNGGPTVQIRILRTYWTSQGNFISSNDTSSASSYVQLKAPAGTIPRYTCNAVLDFFSNMSDIVGNSKLEISFSTEPIDVSYWPTEDKMTIIGDDNGQIRTPASLSCSVAANPPAIYTWIDESNGNITNGPTIIVYHGGKYTCNASNVIRGQNYQTSKSVNLQVPGDDTNRPNILPIILGACFGAAVLIIIIVLVIVLCRKCHKHNSNEASDVGHINHVNEHELNEIGEESSTYDNDIGESNTYDNDIGESNTYDNDIGESNTYDNDIGESNTYDNDIGESNTYETGFRNTVNLDDSEYASVDGIQRPVPMYPEDYEELIAYLN